MKILNIKNQILKIQKGFTVVELMIYMGLLTVVLGILTTVFVDSLDVQLESEADSSVSQDGNYILAKLAYDIHRATSITSPPTLGGTNTSFQINIGGVDYSYSLNGGNLEVNDGVITNTLNSYSTNVSNFSVTRLGNSGSGKVENSLRISFTLTSKTLKNTGAKTKDFQTSISLRRQ